MNVRFVKQAEKIWILYKVRGFAQNRIIELNYDFGFNIFYPNDFYATEAACTFALIAYNLVALFRTFVFQQKTQKPLSTLRYRNFATGAYFKKINNKPVLKIVLSKKKRAWVNGIWKYQKSLVSFCYCYCVIRIIIFPFSFPVDPLINK